MAHMYVTAAVPPELYQRIRKAAAKEKITQSAVIRRALTRDLCKEVEK